jgi:class 3 adenylate cyclase/CheY-like chemotaxis protein
MTDLQPSLLDDDAISAAEDFRRRKVTSVLTIVFTDIARSTELREKLGEVAYEQIRVAYDEAVRGVIESESAGALVKSTGDGALAVFAEPSTAVVRALQIQSEGAAHPHFRLRIGIDMGQVSVVSSGGIVADVFGRHVNRAARIQALAEPEHVLTSFHVYDCAVAWLTGTSVRWHNHGTKSLKGFSEAVSILEPYDPKRTSPQSLQSERRKEGDETERTFRPWPTSAAVRIHPIEWAPRGDPIRFYGDAISLAVARLDSFLTQNVSILWVDDFPANNTREMEALCAAGCRVDVAVSTSEATSKISVHPYSLILSDMGRGNNPVAGLELLDWIRAQGTHIPTIIYCSSRAVSRYGQEAMAKGAVLCTAGLVSLLDGMLQVFEYLWHYRLLQGPSQP